MKVEFSYDYELAWGTYEMVGLDYLKTNVLFSNTAAALMLQAHEQAQVPAHWGMVGAALSREPLEARILQCEEIGAPAGELRTLLHSFSEEEVCDLTSIPDEFVRSIKGSQFANAACHTYSHRYAPGASSRELLNDLDLAISTMARVGLAAPGLLIAPKNLVTPALEAAVEETCISEIRRNPENFLYRTHEQQPSALMGRALRLARYADAFVPMLEFVERMRPSDTSLQCEGNFFLRPGLPPRRASLHLKRLGTWLQSCSDTGRVPHLWGHPHNFAADTDKSIRFLEDVFTLCEEH